MVGLGDRFRAELDQIVSVIQRYPDYWFKVGKVTHRALFKRFPYMLMYSFDDEVILITAIAHQHRDPVRYSDRMI